MAKKLKLHQAVAVLEGEKTRYSNDLTVLDKQVQRRDPFEGLSRTYAPFRDAPEERKPPESKKVQHRAEDLFANFRGRFVALFDAIATNEWGNQQSSAVADVVVRDTVVLKGVPVTYLIFLEKKLVELASVVRTAPALDTDVDWEWDENARLFRGPEVQKVSTRKKKVAIVKIEPTEHHPGQAEAYDEDVPVGLWTEQRLSGAISETGKRELLERFEELIRAVRLAREEANSVEVEPIQVGDDLFRYLFR